jgi:HlyD family secretion protein
MLANSTNSVNAQAVAIDVQLAQIDDQLEKCNIKSPIDGTVLVKYAEMGELTGRGKPLFKVADVENMYLKAYVTASQLTEIILGEGVKVFGEFGESDNRTYDGKIIWISSKSEFTPKTIQTQDERANLVYAVKIAVKNDGYLKIGMYGGFKITAKNL